jgi:hypothetical protein
MLEKQIKTLKMVMKYYILWIYLYNQSINQSINQSKLVGTRTQFNITYQWYTIYNIW